MARLAARAPLACYVGSILIVWLITVACAAAVGRALAVNMAPNAASCILLLVLFARSACSLPSIWSIGFAPCSRRPGRLCDWISPREYPRNTAQ